MLLILEFSTVVEGYNIYSVFIVDDGVYFCSPKYKRGEYWYIDAPEFYISKINGKWKVYDNITGYTFINDWLFQDATEAISRYLFNLQFKPSTWKPK